MAYVESLFMPWNIDALVDGFTADCIVRFGVVPEFRGQDAIGRLFQPHSQASANWMGRPLPPPG